MRVSPMLRVARSETSKTMVAAKVPIQLLILHIPTAQKLTDQSSQEYEIWNEALEIIERSNDVQHMTWGIGIERYWEVQVHITRKSLHSHKLYLASQAHVRVLEVIRYLTKEPIVVRHVLMQQFTQTDSPFHAPYTGTAIYLECKTGLWDAAWNLWTQIVPSVDGCSGVAGGYVQELVEKKPNAYLVYVGWTDLEKHERFHHTNFFERRRVILDTGNSGWTEYGHIRFMEERDLRLPPKL